MSCAQSILSAIGLGASVMIPVGADDNATTSGRSIATLARVTLESRDGSRIALGSRVRPGKPTLISMWASWCPPCIAEAPYLDKIRRKFGSRYNFLYINRSDGVPDPDQPPSAVARFLTRGGMADVDYVIADVKAYIQIVGSDINNIPAGKIGIPRVYLFDRHGRQIFTAYGFQDADGPELEQRVQQALTK